MKRQFPVPSSGAASGDIKVDLSPEQLQGIGAVAMAWNEAEAFVDWLLYTGLSLSAGLWLDVAIRINGIDGKIEIINKAASDLGVPEECQRLIQGSLGDLKSLKAFRDAVIHARIYDSTRGIGTVVERRARISQVLLTAATLDALYERLVMLREELGLVMNIFDLHRTSRGLNIDITSDVQPRADRLREIQTRRRALPRLPDFPENDAGTTAGNRTSNTKSGA